MVYIIEFLLFFFSFGPSPKVGFFNLLSKPTFEKRKKFEKKIIKKKFYYTNHKSRNFFTKLFFFQILFSDFFLWSPVVGFEKITFLNF